MKTLAATLGPSPMFRPRRPSRPASRTLPAVLLPAALACLSLPAAGQAIGGSQSGIAIAQATVNAGGLSGSSTARLAAGLGQTVAGPEASSANFVLQEGVVWILPQVTTAGPLVFGVKAESGSKDGGEPTTVFGFNFNSPGAGAADVLFAGAFGSSTQVASNTTITTFTPAGVNAFGNPLAAVPLEVVNNLGSHVVPDAYVYEPALLQQSKAQVGSTFVLRFLGEPQSLLTISLGQSTGTGIPLPPFDGALELSSVLLLLAQSLPSPGGQEFFAFDLPDNPVLVGASVGFQALAVTDLLAPAGSFSNLLSVTILP